MFYQCAFCLFVRVLPAHEPRILSCANLWLHCNYIKGQRFREKAAYGGRGVVVEVGGRRGRCRGGSASSAGTDVSLVGTTLRGQGLVARDVVGHLIVGNAKLDRGGRGGHGGASIYSAEGDLKHESGTYH